MTESQEQANRRAADGYAWELWALVSVDGWSIASLFMTSASGDWVRDSSYCFRPNGVLLRVEDSHRTFYAEDGLVNDTFTATYSDGGTRLSSKTDAYYVKTRKRPRPNSYMRPAPIIVRRVQDLPFFSLIPK